MPVGTEFLNNTCLQNWLFPKDYASSGFKSHSSSSVDELSMESTDFDPYINCFLYGVVGLLGTGNAICYSGHPPMALWVITTLLQAAYSAFSE